MALAGQSWVGEELNSKVTGNFGGEPSKNISDRGVSTGDLTF